MRVLLIDDEEELVSTLAERLCIRGIEAEWACDVRGAISLADEMLFDIAVIDVKMPGTSGFELKNILQTKFKKMKFVFLTGHGSEDDYEKGMIEAGEKYYLIKPININELVNILQELYNE
jgi:DNA-binding response OmpR family regulator